MEQLQASIVEIVDPSWTGFVASHPAAGVFHTPEWTSVVADCYRFRSFAIVVRNSREVVAGCPVIDVRQPLGNRRWVSLPFTDGCPLLIAEGTPSTLAAGAIADVARESGIADFEIRAALPEMSGAFPVQRGYAHRVCLPSDPEELHVRKSYRNLRNRAQRSGVTIRQGTTSQDVDEFYRLHVMTRRRHGVPVQPKRFFDLIYERLIASGMGFVLTAVQEGRPAASSVFLGYKDTLVTKFGASDPALRDIGAGHLLDWESLTAACRDGYRVMDWGRTDADAVGLAVYKMGWGAVQDDLIYTHIARHVPAPTGRGVGPVGRAVIRNSPEWVCRSLGELLYRWAA